MSLSSATLLRHTQRIKNFVNIFAASNSLGLGQFVLDMHVLEK